MQMEQITEEEAFKRMRDSSMTRQMTMESLAKEIIAQQK